ncbi:MAG: hypothetical protein AAGA99_11730 [Actinomycetota bacterium]
MPNDAVPFRRSALIRRLAPLAVVLAAAAGCSSSDDADVNPSSSVAAPAQGSGTSGPDPEPERADATSASTTAAAPAATDEGSGAVDDGGSPETVTFVDGAGVEVTLPVTSEGVLALDFSTGLTLLTLDVAPIAVEIFDTSNPALAILDEEGVERIPTGNLEASAALDPELIIGISSPRLLQVREELEAIAPVAYPDFLLPWDEQMAVIAELTARADTANVVRELIDARTEGLRAALADAGLAGARASIIQLQAGAYYSYDPTSLVGGLFEDLGFTRSELQSGAGAFGFIVLSEELVAQEAEADVLFAIGDNLGDAGSVLDNPTVDVGDTPTGLVDITWSGVGGFPAWLMLDDIESLLLGDGTVTSPDELVDAWREFTAAIDESR